MTTSSTVRSQTRRLDLEVRPYRPGDEIGIVSLYNRVFGEGNPRFEPRTLAMWNWEYGACPAGRSIIVGVDPGGRIVAHYAALPLRFWVRGEETVVSQGVDTMVDASHRSGLRKHNAFLATAHAYFAAFGNARHCYCSYGFPNRRALRVGMAKLAYEPVHVPVPTVYHNLWEDRQPTSRRRLEVVSVDRFGDEVDELWRRCRDRYSFSIVRDARYLNWRYADIPVPYRRFELRHRGQLRGVFVVRENWNGAPILAVVEYFADADDREAFETMLHHSVGLTRSLGQGRLELWLPERSPWFRHALRLGFRTEPTALSFCCRLYRCRDQLAWHRDHWYYTIGDSDIF